jgi:hypothetical protein
MVDFDAVISDRADLAQRRDVVRHVAGRSRRREVHLGPELRCTRCGCARRSSDRRFIPHSARADAADDDRTAIPTIGETR